MCLSVCVSDVCSYTQHTFEHCFDNSDCIHMKTSLANCVIGFPVLIARCVPALLIPFCVSGVGDADALGCNDVIVCCELFYVIL